LIDVKEHTADKLMITERPWGHGFKSHPAHHVKGLKPPQFLAETGKKPEPFKKRPDRYGMSRAKYQHLLEDLEVKRWYDNVARGSKITADVYLRRLGAFCIAHNMSSRGLAELSEQDIANLLMDTISGMEEKGYAGSYIESTVKSIKSWLRHKGVKIPAYIKINGTDDTPTLTNEQSPTCEQLSRVFRACWLGARAAAGLIAFTGMRPQAIGNYWGTDGLRIGDFLEVEIDNENKKVEFKATSTMVRVRKQLSKAGHQYLTFLCEEGCRYLKEYWEYRMQHGEVLTPDSPAIKARKSYGKNQFIRTTNIGDKIREGIRAAGFKWRPYILRCYFDTQLLLAESKGLMLRDYRTFWMGHKGDIEHRYTTNKYRLPPPLLDDMRSAYRRSQAYLQTEAPSGMDNTRLEFRRQLLIVAGYSEDDVAKVELEKLSDNDIRNRIKERLLKENNNNGNDSRTLRQKVVPLDEVENHVEAGWEYVSQLPNGKAIIKGSGKADRGSATDQSCRETRRQLTHPSPSEAPRA